LVDYLSGGDSASGAEQSDPGAYGGAGRKHSGLGVAAFVIAVLVLGLDLLLAVSVASGLARSAHDQDDPGGVARLKGQLLSGGVVMGCLNSMNLPLCLVGVGLAVAGLVSQRGHNHLFTWIGLLGNGVIVLGFLALLLLAAIPDGGKDRRPPRCAGMSAAGAVAGVPVHPVAVGR
jgi:hypothetical protein